MEVVGKWCVGFMFLAVGVWAAGVIRKGWVSWMLAVSEETDANSRWWILGFTAVGIYYFGDVMVRWFGL